MRALPLLVCVYIAAICQPCLFAQTEIKPWPDLPLPIADPPYYRVHYSAPEKPAAPKPNEQKPNETQASISPTHELIYGVSYTVWIPPGVTKLRGVIVHQHGCGEGACRAGQTAAFDLHWQALAKKHGCALMGPGYEQPEGSDCQMWCDPRNGSGKKFLQALDELAVLSGHPELNRVPWALWGHSGGGTWVGTMLMLHPDRIAAVWLRSGAPRLTPREDTKLPQLIVPPAALTVPAMCNLGTKEGVSVTEGRFAGVWPNVERFFKALRSQGALIGVSVDPNSSHDCGNQRYLAIPWFDACLAARLSTADDNKLRPMPVDQAWLAPLLGVTAAPQNKFEGDPLHAVWLPDERSATAWMQYTKDAGVEDSSMPPSPTLVQVSDGKLTWTAEADFESGLAGFIILRDGAEIARVPAKNTSPYGRPIFQKNSYSDTPSQPLEQMTYTDRAAEPAKKYDYQVIAINTVGLESIRK